MMLAKRVIDSPELLRELKAPRPVWHVLRSQVSAAINRAVAALFVGKPQGQTRLNTGARSDVC